MMTNSHGLIRPRRRCATIAAAVLAVLLLPSCTRVIDDARGVAAAPGHVFGSSASVDACTPVDALEKTREAAGIDRPSRIELLTK